MAISDKQRETVLRCLEQGLSLRKACTKAEVATPTAIHRLCDADTAFSDQYARARQEGYAVLAEQLIESLDDNDTDPARLRIQVDTRKWMLSKMLPKVYGDRLNLEHSGSVSRTDQLTDDELQAVLQAKTPPTA